jgi:hypothetical protein
MHISSDRIWNNDDDIRKSGLLDLLWEQGEPGRKFTVGVHFGGEVVHVFIVDVGCRRRPRAGEPVYRDPVENCMYK